ncbi:hypothetical protein [Nocardia sp. NPDC056100]|uniref:hypothetical protein n=1 Tax=Nocardia sp. NPDC056100 TaxID=3345712 RepID=UPI0035E0460F
MFIEDLLREWNIRPGGEVVLKHPFASGGIADPALVAKLGDILSAPLSSLDQTLALDTERLKARCWTAGFEGQEIHGMTVGQGTRAGVEIQVLLSSYPGTTEWGDRVRMLSGDLMPAQSWDLPAGIDRTVLPLDSGERVDPRLPFDATADIVFRSPVSLRPVAGIDDVRTIVSHAAAVYGERDTGLRMMAKPNLLSLWTCEISGIPVEAASLIRVDHELRVQTMTLAFRPWPVVRLFRDRVIARTRDLIDPSYYDSN